MTSSTPPPPPPPTWPAPPDRAPGVPVEPAGSAVAAVTPIMAVAPVAPVAAAPAPLRRAERSLAPDIARGAMLLFIAVANVGIHRFGYPVDGDLAETGLSVVDRAALFVETWWVADRSRPMFAILYGFGIAMMASRMASRGVDVKGVRRVLRRRSLWLVLFGVVHAALLFVGDILAPYGATGLIALLLVHRSDRALRRWFWVSLVLWEGAMLAVLMSPLPELLAGGGEDLTTQPGMTYLEQLGFGLSASLLSLVMAGLLGFVAPVVIGFALHRRGWLEHPEQHVASLRRVLAIAVGVNVVANLPYALSAAEVWHPDGWVSAVVWELHSVSGLLMGAGYICGFALLAVRWRERGRTGVPRLLAAVGERSLTAYLLQSVIMAPLLQMWGLGLGGRIGTAQAYLVAIGTWLVILGLMVGLDRAGRRGPFEVLLRRLTYGRPRDGFGVPAAGGGTPRAEAGGPAAGGGSPRADAGAHAAVGAPSGPVALPAAGGPPRYGEGRRLD